MAYDDRNRAFVQAFMARRVLTNDQLKPILAAILSVTEPNTRPESITQQIIQTYLTAANNALSPYDLQIRMQPSQISSSRQNPTVRTTYYVLTNTSSDPIIQLATAHSPDEIAFFRRVLDAMFDGPNNCGRREVCAVRGIDAIQLHRIRNSEPVPATQDRSQPQIPPPANLTMREAEAALAAFVAEGWLERSKTGYYSLAPRALAELHRYLIDTYNVAAPPEDGEEQGQVVERIKSCHGCKEILTVGQRCETRECPIRLHDPCAEGFFRSNIVKKCPACGVDWSGNCFVGEKADRVTASSRTSQVTVRSSGVGSTQTRRSSGADVGSSTQRPSRRVIDPLDEDDDEDDDDED